MRAKTEPLRFAPKTEWKLLSGLTPRNARSMFRSTEDGLSSGAKGYLAKHRQKSCWLIDLETAKIEDLLSRCEQKGTRSIVGNAKDARFSPDGKHLRIQARMEQKSACVFDFGTGRSVVVSIGDCDAHHVDWQPSPCRGLGGLNIRDLAGNLQEKRCGWSYRE